MTTNNPDSTTAEEVYNQIIYATTIAEKRAVLQNNIEQLFETFNGNDLHQFASEIGIYDLVGSGIGKIGLPKVAAEIHLFAEYYHIRLPEHGGNENTLDYLTLEKDPEDTVRMDQQMYYALQTIYSGFVYMVAVNELTDVSTDFHEALEQLGKPAEESDLPSTLPETSTDLENVQHGSMTNIYYVTVTLDATRFDEGIVHEFTGAQTVEYQNNTSELQIEYSVAAPNKYEAYRNVVNLIESQMALGDSDVGIRSAMQETTTTLVNEEDKSVAVES